MGFFERNDLYIYAKALAYKKNVPQIFLKIIDDYFKRIKFTEINFRLPESVLLNKVNYLIIKNWFDKNIKPFFNIASKVEKE